ncbi:hypothetical protein PFISCL1PPCAC_17970 [Pristionchus fissidentatus]|uniref:AH domain-containing protein n=1 Tax=Pristionchus fissidentatus TaxID=1538716 RepID=A0AAV5W556_9BILA|nr:hypothetical protein PFISCL1PPCAC_17970 [Pristionchus fissidentatus]
MGTRLYESSTSGMNFDRFLDNFDENTISKMKRKYWTAKQMLKEKLGHKEDDFLRASDADLDAKLTLFTSIRLTSEKLLCCVDEYQAHIIDAAQCSNELGRFMKREGREEKRKHLSLSMIGLGRALCFTAHRLAAVRKPIVRFYDELHVFVDRAVADCAQTVDAVERARTEYRGSLLWMQNKSQELDPDSRQALDSFRESQAVVKANKERLDALKVDTLQKVHLLSASRVNLLVHLLGSYAELLSTYYERTSAAFGAIATNLSAYEHYDFEILTDLVEPSRRIAAKVRQESVDAEDEKRRSRLGSKSSDKEEKAPTDGELVKDLLDFEGDEEGAFRDFLFGRSTPDEERLIDSPLGILDDEDETENKMRSPTRKANQREEKRDPMSILSHFSIGPLLPSPAATLVPASSPITPLAPPPAGSTVQPPLATRSPPPAGDLLNFNLESTPATANNATASTTSAFPNPFDGTASVESEWASLLSQCDFNSSNGAIQWS